HLTEHQREVVERQHAQAVAMFPDLRSGPKSSSPANPFAPRKLSITPMKKVDRMNSDATDERPTTPTLQIQANDIDDLPCSSPTPASVPRRRASSIHAHTPVGEPQFLMMDPPSSPPESQEDPDEAMKVREADELGEDLANVPDESDATVDVIPGTTYEDNEGPVDEDAENIVLCPPELTVEADDAEMVDETLVSANGNILTEQQLCPSEASIDPGLPAAQLAAEEEFFRRSTATNASIAEDSAAKPNSQAQAGQIVDGIDVQDFLTSDAFVDAPTVPITSDITESEVVDASQEIVREDQDHEKTVQPPTETETLVRGTKVVESTTTSSGQYAAETPIGDGIRPTATTNDEQQNERPSSPADISKIANSLIDSSPAKLNKAMPSTEVTTLSHTPHSQAQSLDDDNLSQGLSQGRKRSSTSRPRGRPSKRPKSETPSQAETTNDVLARTPDVNAEKPMLDCIIVATPEFLRQRGQSSVGEARRAVPLKPSRPANTSSSRQSSQPSQPSQLSETAVSVEAEASRSVTPAKSKKKRSRGSLPVNDDETAAGEEDSQQEIQVEQTPASKRQKSSDGTPRSSHKKRSSQILSHVEITSSRSSFGSLENGQNSRASSAEVEFTREEIQEIEEVVLASRTSQHHPQPTTQEKKNNAMDVPQTEDIPSGNSTKAAAPAASKTAAPPAPATPTTATTPTTTRTILSPRSLLRNLNSWINDIKTMVLGSQEEREFDDALFEARRAVHEAGRRGRET
ncbi:hypothetical protein LTS18_003376, partial [Coniosporium uncinatum]